ncbi:MAG: acyltransferase [Chitinophagaceae bacterium]
MPIKQNWLSKAFNLPILQKERMQWVDYLRGIAIVLVVYRHILIGIERSGIIIPPYLTDANMIFYSFRMPLFFILAGIFINSSLKKRTIKQFAFVKFEHLLYPYLVWSFLQITIQIIFSNLTNSDRGIEDYTYIFYQPRNLDQFWYLPALFNTTMIYSLIKIKFRAGIKIQIALGIILYFLSSYMWGISMLSDWMEFYIFFALGNAISNFFFVESTQRFLQKPVLFVFIIPVFVLTQLYYLQQPESYYLQQLQGKVIFLAIALAGCLCMLILSFRLQRITAFSFLRVLGYHSLYIYVMHVFVAALIRIVLTNLLGIHNPPILLFWGIVFGVTVPVVFYNFFIKEKLLWFLFSLKKYNLNSQQKEYKR